MANESDSSVEVTEQQEMSLGLALLPVLLLITALSWNVYVFGDDALSGSSQMIILLVTGLAAAIGIARGIGWKQQQASVVATIGNAMPSILILLLVGALASVWLLCGTVPVLVYYGVKLLNPTVFLVAACIACALTSLISGSSWSTAATIGVAMVGVGRALEIPDGLIGGAIISGSYFGDKVSPLSDTTNLAAAVTETPLFDHIRYLFLTTGPSMLITLVLFTFLGLNLETSSTAVDVSMVLGAIDERFNISLWLLLPAVITLGLIVKKVDAIPALFSGIIVGAVFAVLFQRELLVELMGPLGDFALYKVLITTLFGGVDIVTSNAMLNDLFSASGMAGMLNTIWLILSAMAFGGVLDACGMLRRMMQSIKKMANSFFSLVAATAGTCMVTNISTSDQYISVAIPGRMYAGLYKEMGYSSQNLSRTLEDTGTVTSVLIPWNTCGAYHAAVLGIGTFVYLPYCFFNIISPFMTLIYAWFMIRIARIDDAPDSARPVLA
ncbi:MAG: sodium:proton antiporter [Gammaproteobacteria bacterium]|nr:sodium:proton antiporter [Gammaproteobacteria bacterium]